MKSFMLAIIWGLIGNTLFAQDFQFALITDIHMSKDSIAYNDLQRSVDQINNTPNLSFVLVTGDLTEEGDKTALEKVKYLLDKLKLKYYAVSGNHETKWSESAATDFAHIFGSERFKFEYNGVLFLGFNTGPVIRMMDGHVAPQDITWLKEELEASKANQPIILVTHYPLTDKDVDNWYEVTNLVRKYDIKAILGGHYHSNRLTFYDGIPAIINRSNLRAKDPVGGYSIYQITADSIKVAEQRIGELAKPWGGFSLNKKYYTTDASPYKYPDFSINEEFPNVKTKWLAETGNAIYCSPIVANNKLYTGDDLGYLSCFSLTDGKKLWDFKSGNRILGTPAVEKDILVFGSADKYIYGINATNGRLIWKVETMAPVMGAVMIEKGIAYIGGSDNSMRALNITNGKLIWEYKDVKGYIETRPLIYDNKVIFGAWDNNLYALNKKNGQLEWIWNSGVARMHFSPAAVWPVATNGKIFVTAPDRFMTAIDAKTGQTVWRTNESMVRETIGLSEDQTRIYSKTMQDCVVAYSTEGNEPVELWVTHVGYGYDHAASMPLEKDGTVFGCTKNGIIFALEGKSGQLLWKHKIGNSLINTLVPLSKHSCVFTSADGLVGILTNNE